MTSKIDTLRHMVAAIGEMQIDYWSFFPGFARRLENELGQFLGESSSVALSSAEGYFSFDQGSYKEEGLGFERGRFRIPLMFRLRNLTDEGEFLIRIKIYFVKEKRVLMAWLGDGNLITVDPENLNELLEHIYKYLIDILSSTAWFDENPGHYQGTQIGFLPSRSSA